MAWHVHDAKQRFSAFLDKALREGPQTVTRGGHPVAVLVSIDECRRLNSATPGLAEFLRWAPDMSDLDLTRDLGPPREVFVVDPSAPPVPPPS